MHSFRQAVEQAAKASNVQGVSSDFEHSGKVYAYNHKTEKDKSPILESDHSQATVEFISKDDAAQVVLTAIVPQDFSPKLLADKMTAEFGRQVKPTDIKKRALGEVEKSECHDIAEPDRWRVVELAISAIAKAEIALDSAMNSPRVV